MQKKTNNDTKSTADSIATAKKEKEIEQLRAKIRGIPVVFQKDTLFYLYNSYGPYDVETRAKYVEDKLKAQGIKTVHYVSINAK